VPPVELVPPVDVDESAPASAVDVVPPASSNFGSCVDASELVPPVEVPPVDVPPASSNFGSCVDELVPPAEASTPVRPAIPDGANRASLDEQPTSSKKSA
jgi:hypothetical protein